jgi:hypothetical protein
VAVTLKFEKNNLPHVTTNPGVPYYKFTVKYKFFASFYIRPILNTNNALIKASLAISGVSWSKITDLSGTISVLISDFIDVSRRESFRSYKKRCCTNNVKSMLQQLVVTQFLYNIVCRWY